jgi:hypothetical protein
MPRARGPKQPITVSVPEIITRERAMFLDRVAGKSVRSIAEEFGISPAEAQAIISSQCTPVDVQLKLHTVELELARIDALSAVYYPFAQKGNLAACATWIRLQERRAAYLGTETPLKIETTMARAEAATTAIRR